MKLKQLPPALIPLAVLQVILLILGLISLFRKPLAFKYKWKWFLLLFVDIIGPIIYFVFGSKSLDEKFEMQLYDITPEI
ncbi:MAG: hypothetical protein FWE29_06180 [Defluviitaleaceae bacterium]|nr:hypothetical protein [Defluviitaleaceae bacterium]